MLYERVVERLAAPLMLGVLGGERRFDAVVPVPLHRSRLRRRGFNQAELLARGLSKKINAPVSDTLQVVRKTRDQVELSAAERKANVEGAFSARGRVRGRILLVDDVFTTGATMRRVRRDARAGRGTEGRCPEPVQDMLAVSHQPRAKS